MKRALGRRRPALETTRPRAALDYEAGGVSTGEDLEIQRRLASRSDAEMEHGIGFVREAGQPRRFAARILSRLFALVASRAGLPGYGRRAQFGIRSEGGGAVFPTTIARRQAGKRVYERVALIHRRS